MVLLEPDFSVGLDPLRFDLGRANFRILNALDLHLHRV